MRIALVHSYYSSDNPSGENSAVDQQITALRAAGHEVELFARRTDELRGDPLYQLNTAMRVATGLGRAPSLSEFRPDVIHIHNLFPNHAWSWLRKTPYPVVSTMHNYRPMCSAGTLFREGKVCTLCPDSGSSVPGLIHGCYRGKVATLPLTVAPSFANHPALRNAQKIIVLSEAMHERYVRMGVPADKLSIVPNFVPRTLDSSTGSGGGSWLYVGRFSPEKGILEIVKQWPPGKRLVLVGSGELEDELRELSSPWVEVVGPVSRLEVVRLLQTSLGLVFPSKWFEGLPMVYIEALCAGLPVLTWAPSVVQQLVETQGTGIVADHVDLETALARAERSFPSLRSHCREIFEMNYTESRVIGRLEKVYEEAIRSHRAG